MLYGINPFLHKKLYLIKCDLSTENDDAKVDEFFVTPRASTEALVMDFKKKVTNCS